MNPSILLSQKNIKIGIGGIEYDFRQTHGETGYQASVERLLEAMECRPQKIYHANQVHGNQVVKVDRDREPNMTFAGIPIFEQTDGLVTGRGGDALLIRMADCTPIVLYDPVQNALSAVHSGWKSTVQEISLEAIKQMEEYYGSKRSDLVVYLGPSIGKRDYPVGLEVFEAFESIGNRHKYFDYEEGQYYLDMVGANLQVLLKAGLGLNQLEWSTESTFSNPTLHSARREGADYGLNALIAYLP